MRYNLEMCTCSESSTLPHARITMQGGPPTAPVFGAQRLIEGIEAAFQKGNITKDNRDYLIKRIEGSSLLATDKDAWESLPAKRQKELSDEWAARCKMPEKGKPMEDVMHELMKITGLNTSGPCDLVAHLFFPVHYPEKMP